jgi:hypothetical protein
MLHIQIFTASLVLSNFIMLRHLYISPSHSGLLRDFLSPVGLHQPLPHSQTAQLCIKSGVMIHSVDVLFTLGTTDMDGGELLNESRVLASSSER